MTAGLNANVADLPGSGIREIMELGRTIEGVIPLWFGEGDDPTPEPIKQAAVDALHDDRTFYVPNSGVPALREALAGYMTRLYGCPVALDRITVSTSGMHGIMLSLQAVLSPGDRIVVVGPIWPNVVRAAEVIGAHVRMMPLTSDGGQWRLDLDHLFDLCAEGTKALFINSPGNPTGWMARRDELQAIFAFCRTRVIWLMADDVYARLVYTGAERAPSVIELAEPDDRVIAINSFSKSWSMTGWRLGWITAPPDLLFPLAMLTEYNIAGPATFVQHAGIAALEACDDHVERMRAAYADRREIACAGLAAIEGVRLGWPDGAFYVFFAIEGEADSMALAKRILAETGVGLAPGIAFGDEGEGYLRACFARRPDDLREAIGRLTEFFARRSATASTS